jgi:hypothetical protein
MEERVTSLPCAICGKPVRLDECKVTDLGEPAHESCLADPLKEQIKQRKTALERWRV